MDFDEIATCVGKDENQPEIVRLLAYVSYQKKLKLPKDDVKLRLNFAPLGLSLIFRPQGRKSSLLVLNAAQAVSDAEAGFKTFPGKLPGGIEFGETQAQVITKLGKPSSSENDMRYDSWRLADKKTLRVQYSKLGMKLTFVTVELPVPS